MPHLYINDHKRLMEEQHLLKLIEKFLDGTANSFEKKQLNDWYKKNNEEESVWLSETADEQEMLNKRILNNIKQHLDRTRTPVISFRRRLFPKIAAIIIGFAVITGYYFYQGKHEALPAVVSASVQAPQHLQENKYIVLPDSSTVLLRSGSKISYAFNGITRELTLTGEAYFDIRHNLKQPFIIHTGKLKTTVLGTAFNIKAYPNQKITVSVTRGKVSVSDGNEKTLAVLLPDQQVIYNEATKVKDQSTVKAQKTVEWAKEDMQFKDMPFKQLADRLARRYNVEIRFQHAGLENCLISGRFDGTESLDAVLRTISATMATTYTIDTSLVTLDGKGCI